MRYTVTLTEEDILDILNSDFETNREIKIINYKPIDIEFEVT